MHDVVPMLTYADGPAAMDWLAEAFGFVEQTRWLDDAGRVSHGEMRTGGDGLVMIASTTAGYEGPAAHRAHCAAADTWLQSPFVVDGVLVYVGDIDAHFDRAVAAGARTLSPVEDGPARLYRAEDLEGHRWMFMQRS